MEVFIYLEDEGTDVWRPVQAERLRKDFYRIISENPDPGDEIWQFEFGDIVRCEERTFANGESRLVAVEKTNGET